MRTEFKWTGEQHSKEGTAEFFLQGTNFFTMRFNSFHEAKLVDSMIRKAFSVGKDTGIDEARSNMNIAVKSLLNQ